MAVAKPLEEIRPPKFQRLRNCTPHGCRKIVHKQTHKNAADIRCFRTPKTHTLCSYIRNFPGIWNFFVDYFILDSPNSLDSKKVWVYYVHTRSFLAKCILVYVSWMHLSKCLHPITTFHSHLHVISLAPGIFKMKNIDLLAEMLGSWPFLVLLIVYLFAGCCKHVCACFFVLLRKNIHENHVFFSCSFWFRFRCMRRKLALLQIFALSCYCNWCLSYSTVVCLFCLFVLLALNAMNMLYVDSFWRGCLFGLTTFIPAISSLHCLLSQVFG